MEDWISKKDLLEETGISYGQLYRWKREGLIPENWFVKRSAFTGQETFLPREKALERIRYILDKREGKSLQAIRAALCPGSGSRVYDAETLMNIPNTLQPMRLMMEIADCQKFDQAQAMLVLLAARAAKAYSGMTESEMSAFLKALWDWQRAYGIAQDCQGSVYILKNRAGAFPLLARPEAALDLSGDTRVVFHMPLSDARTQLYQALMELEET